MVQIEDPIEWGAFFGRTLFHVLSTDHPFEPENLLSLVGYNNQEDLGPILEDIESAISDVRSAIEDLSRQLEVLLEGQDRTNFLNSYTTSGQAATHLGTAMAEIGGWIDAGVVPDEAAIAEVQVLITTAIDDLGFSSTNPTTGTIPLMMKVADTAAVSDLVDYWADIDATRAGYRASLAQGLLALELLARWDETGSVGADAETFRARAMDYVKSLYEYGVGIDQAPERTVELVYPAGADTVYAPGDYPGAEGEQWTDVSYAGAELEPVLQQLVAEYDPALNGGISLETYLIERGYQTRYYYVDSFDVKAWEDGVKWMYQAWATQGRIVGNGYESVRTPIGSVHEYGQGQNEAQTDIQLVTQHGAALRLLEVGVGADIDTLVQAPAISNYIHVRGDDTVYAPPTYDGATNETWNELAFTRADLEPVLQHLASSYNPAEHDGQTLEAYLTERGFATSYWYPDTAFVDSWDDGVRWYHQAKITLGRITGNTYEARTMALSDVEYAADGPQREIDRIVAAYSSATALRTMNVTVDNAGRAADLSEESILAAAYGDST